MDSFTSFFDAQSSSRNRWSYDSLKNFRQISPVVQTHLKQKKDFILSLVYFPFKKRVEREADAFGCLISGLSLAMLCTRSICSWSLPSHLWNIGGFLTLFGCMGSIIWLLSTPPYQEQKRVSLLMAAALVEGASIGPLIELAIDFDSSILVSAFVGCAVAFGCFSAAAMIARRREYLYLGALLSSGLSILFWLHFASSIFGGSMALFKFELYFGLLVFVGYIVVDTQDIIEKAHFGDLDYVKHALTLFTDFVAVFVRILIIMLKNASEKEERRRRGGTRLGLRIAVES
ncbi:UNVERIFIED_CONTAM: Bax inhibitor 1 [Sesamum angustifolium]|uniref:Bax inhibitor 1 n=1 Tax=Sesamum angustifolium TaxID=2727405 RepID=A0AAW2M7V4_9LAMI